MSKDFSVQLDEVMVSVSNDVKEATDKAFQQCAKQTANNLQGLSPSKHGDYARSWTSKRQGDGTYVVYNKEHYMLTHLLENGHVIRNKKGEFGRAPAHPHISTAEDQASEEVVSLIERRL